MYDGYINRAFGAESSFNPFAKNPRSSATGLGQFTTGTWNGLMQLQPELGLTPDGRTDPEQAKRAMIAFTGNNARALEKLGIPVNDNSLYAMHRFGEGAGPKLLQADPNAPIASLVPPNVLAANPDLNGKTVGSVLNRWQDGGALTDVSAQSRQPGNFAPGAKTIFPGKRETPSEPGGFMAGGPGALIGLPNGVTSGGYDVGSALQGAGAGLASISSPQQGAALAQLAKTNDDQWHMTVNPATGAVMRINRKTGKVEAVTGAVPIKSEADKAYDTQMGKTWAEQNEKIINDASRAQQQLSQLDQLKAALANPNVYQGFAGDSILSLKKAAQAIGMGVEGVADSELASKVTRELALQLRNPTGGAGMPGALSDQDRKFLESMVPSLQNSREGNQQIVDMYRALNQRALDVDRLRSQYEEKNGRIDAGFTRELRKYANENPLFKQQAAPAAAPSTRPPLDSIFR
jgi:hypothetical protein